MDALLLPLLLLLVACPPRSAWLSRVALALRRRLDTGRPQVDILPAKPFFLTCSSVLRLGRLPLIWFLLFYRTPQRSCPPDAPLWDPSDLLSSHHVGPLRGAAVSLLGFSLRLGSSDHLLLATASKRGAVPFWAPTSGSSWILCPVLLWSTWASASFFFSETPDFPCFSSLLSLSVSNSTSSGDLVLVASEG